MVESVKKKRRNASAKKVKKKTLIFSGKGASEAAASLVEGLSLRVREGLMFGWLFLASFICLSLFSYDASDPAWSFIGSVNTVSNSAGRTGAWIADALYTLFGYLAWLMPAIVLQKAVRVFRYRYRAWHWQPWLVFIRFSGALLALSAGAALTSLHYHFLDAQLPASSGGIMGSLLIEHMLPAFNVTGSTLILMAAFFTGFTVYTDISWFRVMDALGQGALILWDQLIVLVAMVRERITEYREQKKREAIRAAKEHEELQSTLQEPVITRPEPPLLIEDPVKPEPVSSIVSKKKQEPVFSEAPLGDVEGILPALGLLDEARPSANGMSQESLDAMSRLLELKLKDFGVVAEVTEVHPGPVITRFEIQPAAGTKASKISNLAKDLARSLAVVSVRVVEVIPGKSVMGIEIPNDDRETVYFSEIIASKIYEASDSPLSLALGHDIAGQPVVVDLAKMPHLLVAGTTGSGKSVGVNAMILSMLFKANPDEVRLIMGKPSADIASILGYVDDDELIHRDNMVVF